MAGDSEGHTTTDHQVIRGWAEERGGRPSTVKTTHPGAEAGILRIAFPDYPAAHDDKLEAVSWEAFFEKFEQSKLAFPYQDRTEDGHRSRFFKFVHR